MNDNEKLKQAIEYHKNSLNMLNEIDKTDFLHENTLLYQQVECLKVENENNKLQIEKLYNENCNLKNALKNNVHNEKLNILKVSEEKFDNYFKSEVVGEKNKFIKTENNLYSVMNKFKTHISDFNLEADAEINGKIEELSNLIKEKKYASETNLYKMQNYYEETKAKEFAELNEIPVSYDNIEKNSVDNLENMIGLNILNKVSILLIILGVLVGALSDFFTPVVKSIIMFALGGFVLVTGEVFNRKKSNVFSLGLTSLGIAILYIALGTSYFEFELMNIYTALLFCMIIAVGSIVLSLYYNAKEIFIFSLIGGYLPIIVMNQSITVVYSAMVYFVFLNMISFIISFRKKWTVAYFIALVLNIVGTAYISYTAFVNDALSIITILYVFATFLVYTIIPLVSSFKQKIMLGKLDMVLIATNTFFSSTIMYSTFAYYSLEDFNGFLAIFYAIAYIIFANVVTKKLNGANKISTIFYLTAYTFIILTIPFQFGINWLSLGWLIEGVVLATYGGINDRPLMKKVGIKIYYLCLASFIFFDFFDFGITNNLFQYKYFAITLGSVIILFSIIRSGEIFTNKYKVIKNITIINNWFYIMYLTKYILPNNILRDTFDINNFNIVYLSSAVGIIAQCAYSYILTKIDDIYDRFTKYTSIVIYIFAILATFNVNGRSVIASTEVNIFVENIAKLSVFIVSTVALFALYDVLKMILDNKRVNYETYPVIVSFMFIVFLTQNLVVQYDLQFFSIAITIIYAIFSLGWIIVGFMRKFVNMRRFGLILSIFSVLKLFIFDISTTSTGYRIISYFALGISLMLISFIYQYFTKKMELELNEQINFFDENSNN